MAERLKEAEMDSKDRLKEKEEIEELKTRIFSGDHEDPNAEFEKVIFILLLLLLFQKSKNGYYFTGEERKRRTL